MKNDQVSEILNKLNMLNDKIDRLETGMLDRVNIIEQVVEELHGFVAYAHEVILNDVPIDRIEEENIEFPDEDEDLLISFTPDFDEELPPTLYTQDEIFGED